MTAETLRQSLVDDTNDSMKRGDKARVAALRLINAAIKQREVDERVELTDDNVLAVLDKMAKQRRESIEQFERAGRRDLVDQENFELDVIKSYLPQALEAPELEALITDAIRQCGAQSVKEMGKVMGILKPQLVGRADMSAVSGRVKSLLN